jgi:hypothetical protein
MTERDGKLRRLWRFLVRTYASADPRSLAVFRIALGTLLFIDVARRLPDLEAHYSNLGWLTNHYALFQPMSDHFFSLYAAFSTPQEVRVLFGLHLLVNLLLIVGWHTRLMHVLAAVLITSLNSRTILLENGGWVVLHLLTVWSMFLPCGQRFSVDAFLASWRKERDVSEAALNDPTFVSRTTAPVVSLAVAALILQWAVIYFFNVAHKRGLPWRDGTAVYYFLQQDRMVTALGAAMREILPLGLIKLMSWSALVIEGSVALLLLFPFGTAWTRMGCWALVCLLHLSIDTLVQLGPFSWAMIVMFFALIPTQFWEALEKRARARKPERTIAYDPDDGLSIVFCRWLRRLDVYGRLRFLAISDAAEQSHGVEKPHDATALAAADGTLVVLSAQANEFSVGAEALRRVGSSLPFGFLSRSLTLPGIRAVVDGAIAQLVERRERLSRRLGMGQLPRQPDERAPEPAPARRFLWRVRDRAILACVLVIMIAEASQVFVENRALPAALLPERRPAWMEAIIFYPRLFQGWSMFAPAPPNDDGHVVVDGRTYDGRKLDPLTGREPDFSVSPRGGYGMNQIWGDFHRRIGEPRFQGYWDGFREFLLHHHELTGRPQDRLVAFDVWFVHEIIPPPHERASPPSRRRMFSHGIVQ